MNVLRRVQFLGAKERARRGAPGRIRELWWKPWIEERLG